MKIEQETLENHIIQIGDITVTGGQLNIDDAIKNMIDQNLKVINDLKMFANEDLEFLKLSILELVNKLICNF